MNFPTTTLSFFIYFGQMISSSLLHNTVLYVRAAYKSNLSLTLTLFLALFMRL